MEQAKEVVCDCDKSLVHDPDLAWGRIDSRLNLCETDDSLR